VSEAAEDKLRFLDFATTVRTSAVHGAGIKLLFQEVQKAFEHYTREVQTADLNRVIESVSLHHAPPSKGRSATRILYGTQVSTRPPVFRFFCNHLEEMSPAYTRYFADQLRYHFDLSGTPIDIQWRSKATKPRKPPNNPYKSQKPHAPTKAREGQRRVHR
jgi:GTP-binding protein